MATLGLALADRPAEGSTKVDDGPISHKGLKSAGPASKSLKLPLQIGFVADQSGIQDAAKAASDVVNAFKKQNVKATVDVNRG